MSSLIITLNSYDDPKWQKKAEDALEAIQQLSADRDELQTKIDELEKNIEKLIALIQTKDTGERMSEWLIV